MAPKSHRAGEPDPHPDGDAPDSESQELTESKEKWLRDLPSKKERYKEPSQLPAWVKLCIAKKKLGYHETWKEAAAKVDKAASTLYNYRSTPAGEQYEDRLEGALDDPAQMAKNLLRGKLGNFTVDFITMWEQAVDANDYSEIRKMWSEVMDRVPGGLSKKGDMNVGEATIQISFSSPEELEPVEIDSDHETIEADYEVVEDDAD